MHFENPAIDTSMVLFEVATAIGNNGISTGFVNPGLSAGSKLVYIFIMWIGRLEVLPVIVLILGIIRGFEPEQKKARHSKNGTSTRNREN
jgi:trk system potassium uptake protein TrkH